LRESPPTLEVDFMAERKMTKAQAVKRIQEATRKMRAVLFADHITHKEFLEIVNKMDALQRKLKR